MNADGVNFGGWILAAGIRYTSFKRAYSGGDIGSLASGNRYDINKLLLHKQNAPDVEMCALGTFCSSENILELDKS